MLPKPSGPLDARSPGLPARARFCCRRTLARTAAQAPAPICQSRASLPWTPSPPPLDVDADPGGPLEPWPQGPWVS